MLGFFLLSIFLYFYLKDGCLLADSLRRYSSTNFPLKGVQLLNIVLVSTSSWRYSYGDQKADLKSQRNLIAPDKKNFASLRLSHKQSNFLISSDGGSIWQLAAFRGKRERRVAMEWPEIQPG